LLDPDQRV